MSFRDTQKVLKKTQERNDMIIFYFKIMFSPEKFHNLDSCRHLSGEGQD